MSIADVAAEAGLEGIWLNGWCYRFNGPYDHKDFCATLAAVTLHSSEVVWIPRARREAASDYQFRLWCTFETAVVAERGLRVRIAGVGLSRTQSLLLRMGSWLPALPGISPPTEIRPLMYFNASLFAMMIACPLPTIPFLLMIFNDPRSLASFLPNIGKQLALAQSGQRVLQTMMRACAAVDRKPAAQASAQAVASVAPVTSLGGSSTAQMACTLATELRHALPWLPAYDRRDVLAVNASLDQLARRPTDPDFAKALAFSAYAAARLEPSPGDAVSEGSLREWLAAKSIPLPGPRSSAGHGGGGAAEPSSWLDEGCALARTTSARLPVSHLATLGWVVERGASSLLKSPIGSLHVRHPHSAHAWSLQGVRYLSTREASPSWAIALVMIAYSIIAASMFAATAILVVSATGPSGSLVAGAASGLGVINIGVAVGELMCGLFHLLVCAAVSSYRLQAAPHMANLGKHLQPQGYSLRAMVIVYGVAVCVVPILWSLLVLVVAVPEGWSADFARSMGDPAHAPVDRRHFTWTFIVVGPSWHLVYCVSGLADLPHVVSEASSLPPRAPRRRRQELCCMIAEPRSHSRSSYRLTCPVRACPGGGGGRVVQCRDPCEDPCGRRANFDENSLTCRVVLAVRVRCMCQQSNSSLLRVTGLVPAIPGCF